MKINFTVLIFILLGIKGFSQIPDFLGIPNPNPSVNKNLAPKSSNSVIANSIILPTEEVSYSVSPSRRENIRTQTEKMIVEDMKKIAKEEEIRIDRKSTR